VVVDIRDIEDLTASQEQAVDAIEKVSQLFLVGVVTVQRPEKERKKEIIRRNSRFLD
jgi:hypothetical protein